MCAGSIARIVLCGTKEQRANMHETHAHARTRALCEHERRRLATHAKKTSTKKDMSCSKIVAAHRLDRKAQSETCVRHRECSSRSEAGRCASTQRDGAPCVERAADLLLACALHADLKEVAVRALDEAASNETPAVSYLA